MDFNIANRAVKRCLKIFHDTAATDYRKQNNGDFMPLCTSCNHTECKQSHFLWISKFSALIAWRSRGKLKAKTKIC